MSKISTKQANKQPLKFESFKTGLDYRTSQTEIAQTALFKANNMEFDPQTGLLRKADGIVSVYDAGADIGSGFSFNGYQLFTVGQTLKRILLSTGTVTTIGTLLGTAQPYYCLWDTNLLIASGGAHLQKVDSSFNLTTLANSPTCHGVRIRESRVMTWAQGDDYLYFSAVGDPTTWDLSPQPDKDWTSITTTTAAYLEIGYQDGLDIISVEPLADDLIIFKGDGNKFQTYRMQNQLPDWIVDTTSTVQALGTKAALNDVFIIGADGFQSMINTQKYGDVEQYNIGKKVNPVLSKTNKDSNSRIWYVPSRNQMFVKLANDKTLWIFHYSVDDGIDSGAWTKRILLDDVQDFWADGNNVYFAYGQNICQFSEAVATELGTAFTSELETKAYLSSYQYNISRYVLEVENRISGAGIVTIGRYTKAITYTSTDDEAFSDSDEAFSDNDPLFGVSQKITKFIDSKTDSFSFNMTCTSGSFGFRSLLLDIAEV